MVMIVIPVEEIEMFEDILEGLQEEEIEEVENGQFDDSPNSLDESEDWDTGEVWSTDNASDIWRT